ncbi:ribosomal maturation YjgA family protein [Dyadobacter sp. OTU695]|uniref:ribosomal maturation YjgA family protein n=1 Tax=Dyadobacter sp. OTU695 TaxID=3043860 RepID=UPI00313C9423
MSRRNYLIIALVILMMEVLIALYVHDELVRPWGGDVLVVVLLYCFVRGVTRLKVFAAAWAVLVFSWFIESLQYLQIIRILRLEGNAIARTIIGTTFSWSDIVAYTLGIVLVVVVEAGKKHAL